MVTAIAMAMAMATHGMMSSVALLDNLVVSALTNSFISAKVASCPGLGTASVAVPAGCLPVNACQPL